MKWSCYYSDLVPPPIFPSFMTSMTAIDSCNTNCSARMTNAGLRLVGGQNVGDGRRRQRRPLHRNRSGRNHHSADQGCANQEYFPHSRSPLLGIALRSGSLAQQRKTSATASELRRFFLSLVTPEFFTSWMMKISQTREVPHGNVNSMSFCPEKA